MFSLTPNVTNVGKKELQKKIFFKSIYKNFIFLNEFKKILVVLVNGKKKRKNYS